MLRKVYSLGLLALALIVGAWSMPIPKAVQPKRGQDEPTPCGQLSSLLIGSLAQNPVASGAYEICEFNVHVKQIPNKVSEYDKDFIEESITSNTLEIQSLQIALGSATNDEWRGLIQLMIAQHTADLQQSIAVAKKIGAETTPNLKHASVYPGTPDYDLGMRYENLVKQYIDPLQAAAQGGPTETPSGSPTAVPSDTSTATGVPADTATAPPSDTPAVTTTGIPTDTATALSSDTPTFTATALPADTATALPSDTPAVTATGLPTDTSTALPSETAIATGAAAVTSVPTTGSTSWSAFDTRSLNIIEDEHTADVQSELAAERLTRNPEIQAFAKHAADLTEMHLLLMGDLKHRMIDNYAPPPPDLQADYQEPRRLEP
jgi:hypothetical protein